MTSILQCPVCREPLFPSANGYQCPGRHSFDVARQGYVNFLLSHRKHSKEPGDSPEMNNSRRRFLDLGWYDRVADTINETLAAHLPSTEEGRSLAILDAGSGEGFYLQRLKDALLRHPGLAAGIDYYGVDISKYAVRMATQRDRSMHWFVASIIDLPFVPRSLDIVLNIFSRADYPEFARILRPTGKLVVVSPGPRHLNGLRQIIYAVAREHGRSAVEEQAQGLFTLAAVIRVEDQFELRSPAEIMDLVAMTPYFWNIDLSTRARIEALDVLATDVDVEIRVFEKSGP